MSTIGELKKKGIKMDETAFKNMIKIDVKEFLSQGIDPKNVDDILSDENLTDILKAPDIADQIKEFLNNPNNDIDSFFQGLLVGTSMGARFGMISAATSFYQLMDNYTRDIPKD